jgi:hypothetical protein
MFLVLRRWNEKNTYIVCNIIVMIFSCSKSSTSNNGILFLDTKIPILRATLVYVSLFIDLWLAFYLFSGLGILRI